MHAHLLRTIFRKKMGNAIGAEQLYLMYPYPYPVHQIFTMRFTLIKIIIITYSKIIVYLWICALIPIWVGGLAVREDKYHDRNLYDSSQKNPARPNS